jgi:hypothetical protein
MGGLTSFASQAFQVLGAVNTVLGAADQFSQNSGKADYEAQKRLNDIRLQNEKNQTELAKQKIGLEAQQAETERRAALRRAVAKQKAAYGASGTGSGSGSAQAVLLGLVDESQEELEQRNALDTLKKAAADENVYAQQRVNTLQLAQLKERDKYNRYTSAYGTVSGLLE